LSYSPSAISFQLMPGETRGCAVREKADADGSCVFRSPALRGVGRVRRFQHVLKREFGAHIHAAPESFCSFSFSHESRLRRGVESCDAVFRGDGDVAHPGHQP
jgi:hypothetical protein